MAGVGVALVHLLLTVAPGVPDLAVAVVDVSRVQTLARVTAQLVDSDSYAKGVRRRKPL